MTLREATAQAYRELGRTDDEIKEMLSFSDRKHPSSIPYTLKEIPAEMERPIIDEIKTMTQWPQEVINAAYEEARQKVMEHDAKN